MSDSIKRPPIPSKLPEDKSDNDARLICIYLNTAIKRAQREGPADDMRLDLNQAIRAIAKIEDNYSDMAKLNIWKEVLQQLEKCYEYIKEKHPGGYDGSVGGKSWPNSWSGHDDNGVI